MGRNLFLKTRHLKLKVHIYPFGKVIRDLNKRALNRYFRHIIRNEQEEQSEEATTWRIRLKSVGHVMPFKHLKHFDHDIPIDRNFVLRLFRPVRRFACFDEGLPIDRYYIDSYLLAHRQDIRGHVLEVGDDTYIRRFGGERVYKCDVLHVTDGNPQATIIADLSRTNDIPSDTFDCIILTQTLQYIYDVQAAIHTLHRILKPGGVILASLPGIAHISRYDMDHWGEYWRFTTMSARRLFESVFPSDTVEVHQYGNMLTAIAFLLGLASEELRENELNYCCPDFQVLLIVRAVKPRAPKTFLS
jgi:SAM-dependent methyltransferase